MTMRREWKTAWILAFIPPPCNRIPKLESITRSGLCPNEIRHSRGKSTPCSAFEKEHRARPEHRAAPVCFAASSGTRPHVVWFVWRGSAPHPATRRPTPRRNLTQSPQSPQRNTGKQPSRTSRTWREENDPRKSRAAPEQGSPKPILFSCGEHTDLDAKRSSRPLCSPPPLCLQTPAPIRRMGESGRRRRCGRDLRRCGGAW